MLHIDPNNNNSLFAFTRVAEDEMLLVVIISLLENMLSKEQLIAAIAYQQVQLLQTNR
jgi:hypothetical protein